MPVDPTLKQLRHETPVRAGMLGSSVAMEELFRRVRLLARSDVPVLICGEMGAGKEAAARALHLNSDRASGPFVAEAAAALRHSLFCRQLFGHVRGAFTGANAAVPGLLDAADGGTFFLDEVADLTLDAQAILSRVLETGDYRPLGTTDCRHSNFRLVTSTVVDLRALVAAGQFRRDLYARLSGAILRVPPLRERSADIVPIASAVIEQVAREMEIGPVEVPDDVRSALLAYHWPGNVRELRHELMQALALSAGATLSTSLFQFLHHPQPEAPSMSARGAVLRRAMSEVEARTIAEALRQAGGNKAEAARRLGLTRRTLYRRLESLGTVETSVETSAPPSAADDPPSRPAALGTDRPA